MRLFQTKHKSTVIHGKKGSVLLLTLIVMITLTSVVGAYLGFVRHSTRNTESQINDTQAIYLAEAGLQKAIWNLMRTVANGGQGENWTTAGTTENLGDGSYTMVAERWDWALADNNATASASSENASNVAANAIDGYDTTYWQSARKVTPGDPQEIIVSFPYTLTINKARFYLPSASSQQRPKAYSWQVSTDGISYTSVADNSNNGNTDVTDEFAAQSNVNYLKLAVTKTGGGSAGVIIATIEAIGSKITVTGTVGDNSREIEQTVAVDDASEEAYDQIDWNEI
jgi:Tfp pilus assembly protein PilX